jgi:hypothetical protein
MSKLLWLAAVPLMTGAMIASTTGSVWAFTQQTLNPNGNYNFDYGPLDGKAKSGTSTDKSDPNSSGFHFNIQGGTQTSPYGFHSLGGDSDQDHSNYFHQPGNGN